MDFRPSLTKSKLMLNSLIRSLNWPKKAGTVEDFFIKSAHLGCCLSSQEANFWLDAGQSVVNLTEM